MAIGQKTDKKKTCLPSVCAAVTAPCALPSAAMRSGAILAGNGLMGVDGETGLSDSKRGNGACGTCSVAVAVADGATGATFTRLDSGTCAQCGVMKGRIRHTTRQCERKHCLCSKRDCCERASLRRYYFHSLYIVIVVKNHPRLKSMR